MPRKRKYQERYPWFIDSLAAKLFPFQESEFEAETFTDIGRQRVDEWIHDVVRRRLVPEPPPGPRSVDQDEQK